MAQSDEELMNRFKIGDERAFAQFYDRHAGRIHGLIVRVLGGCSHTEDVLQETFWQVWSRAAQYDAGRSSPLAWVILIARSRALDHLRGLRERTCGPLTKTTACQPSSDMENREAAQAARASLARLPAEQREAIHLAFFCGLTYAEIARQESVPLGTIKTRIRRGMHRLREMLNGTLEGHDDGR